jgi:outer membrane protein assembly factor BamB
MFRVSTGEKLWQAKIPVTQEFFKAPTTMTMTRGVVVTSWSLGSEALDMASGKSLWKRVAAGQCKDGGVAGGGALLLRQDCFDKAEGQDHFRVHKLNPRTGEIEWTYKVARGVKYAYFLSTSPAVVAVAAGDYDVTDILSLDGQGKLRTSIRMEGDHYNVECNADRVDICSGAVVSKDKVFVTSGVSSEELGNNTNWIVAFDLATGHTGVKFDAGEDQQLTPIRMSGSKLLAVNHGTDTFAPDSLVSLDPETGKKEVYFYFTVPRDVGGDGLEISVENGNLFYGYQFVEGSGKRSSPDAKWLAYRISAAG